MGYALPQTVQMVDEECIRCGTPFAWPKTLRDACLSNGQTFYCPNGHSMCWRETEAQRLQKKLDESARMNTRLAQQVREAQEAEQKAVKERKRIQRRVNAGVCTCCNRTFQNLARHMQTKHKANSIASSATGKGE